MNLAGLYDSFSTGLEHYPQLIENPKAFQRLAREALDTCHFVAEKESFTKACYEWLLSYRNQFDHPLVDRP